MQPMAMALSRRCVYAKLHAIWPKSMLYIFPLSSHSDKMRIRARIGLSNQGQLVSLKARVGISDSQWI